MVVREHWINTNMNKLVIYPGRFHPFHKGHKSSYDFLAKEYGGDNVYVATSNAQAPLTSPFSFEEKKQMMALTGVPEDKVIQVKNPYRSEELTGTVTDPENTALIYGLSEKDVGRFTFTKKDGSKGYMQPYPKDEAQLKPMTEHAYIVLTPTVKFKVQGKDSESASQVRAAYTKADEKTRKRILTDLYGTFANDVKEIWDNKMGIVEELSQMMTTLKESRDPLDRNMRKVELALEMERTVKQIEEADLEGHYVQGERIVPAGGMGSWTAEGLKENIVAQMSKFVNMLRQQNYQGAYEELFSNNSFQSKLEALTLLDQKKLPRR